MRGAGGCGTLHAVRRLNFAWALMAVWVLGVVLGHAQTAHIWEERQEDLPPPPESMVLDRGDLLSRHPEVFERISAKLHALDRETGFRVYFHVQSGLVTDDASTTADRVHEAWLDGGEGLIVVFVTDSGELAFSRPFLSNPEKLERLSTLGYISAVGQVMERLDRTLPEVERVEQMVGFLTSTLRELLAADAPEPRGQRLKVALLLVGGGALLALGWALAAWFNKRGPATGEYFWFHDRGQPQRLGAPCGGGKIGTVKF